MSFDGKAERDNIFAELQALAGGRVHRGIPDDTELERFTGTGHIKPFIVAVFGRPIPTAGDRSIGGEDTQPYMMAITVSAYAADSDTAENLAVDITKLLINFAPNGDNATPLKGAGGYAPTKPIERSKPTRFEEVCLFTTIINQTTP